MIKINFKSRILIGATIVTTMTALCKLNGVKLFAGWIPSLILIGLYLYLEVKATKALQNK
jgi:hypothetical protein